jgi:hypothetical protein
MRTLGTSAIGWNSVLPPVPTGESDAGDATNESAPPPTHDQVRESVRAAVAELVAAIRSFRVETRPVFSPSSLGTETITNAGSVASNAALAATRLNDALAQVDQIRAVAPHVAAQVEAAIRRAGGVFAAAGVRGVTIESIAGRLHVSVDVRALAESLEQNAA